jgi:hypothetical protein
VVPLPPLTTHRLKKTVESVTLALEAAQLACCCACLLNRKMPTSRQQGCSPPARPPHVEGLSQGSPCSSLPGAQRAAARLGLALVAPDTSPRGLNVPGESDSWDFGVGAGFYLNATVEQWKAWRMYDYVAQVRLHARCGAGRGGALHACGAAAQPAALAHSPPACTRPFPSLGSAALLRSPAQPPAHASGGPCAQELPALLGKHFSAQLDLGRLSVTGHSMGGHGALVLALRNPGRYKVRKCEAHSGDEV